MLTKQKNGHFTDKDLNSILKKKKSLKLLDLKKKVNLKTSKI